MASVNSQAQFALIQQADYVLGKCGGRLLPGGVRAVDLPGALLYNVSNAANTVVTGSRDNYEDTAFYVRSVSVVQDVYGTYGRILWPDGRYMSNVQCALGGVGWFGCFKRILTKEVAIPPRALITITTNPVPVQGSGQATSTSLLFEGVFRYLIKGGNPQRIVDPAEAQLYAQSAPPQGNILAPELMLDTTFAEVPPGTKRGPYTLVSISTQAATIATPGGTATIEVPVSSAFDFFARRFEFETSFTSSAAGEVLVKVRDGSGYALYSDYAPVSQIKDAPLAKEWCVKAGTSMYFDFLYRNTTGSGNLVLTAVNVVGSRQKKG